MLLFFVITQIILFFLPYFCYLCLILKPKLGMNVDSIISRLYPDDKEAVLALLDEHKLVVVTDKTIELLEAQFAQMEVLKPFELDMSIGNMASSYLTQVNAIVASAKDEETKESLRNIIFEISIFLIRSVIEFSNREVHETVSIIKKSLKMACQINNYDFDTLNRFLRLDLMYKISAITKKKLTPQVITYYEWKEEPYKLDEIARNLKAENSIDSVKTFKQLFEPHENDLKVAVNMQSLPFIMVMLDVFKQKGLILPKGRKGHFTPLVQYGTNLAGSELFIKEPKHIMYAIKKDEKKYEKYLRKVNNWLTQIE